MDHFKHPIVFISAVLSVVVVGIGYWFLLGPSASRAVFVAAHTQSLEEAVSVSGPVKSAGAVDLGFERSGKIARVNAQVGDVVTAGTTLVSLESADLAAQLAGAQAALSSQEAKLAELQRGARPEDLALAQTQVSNATLARDDARKSVQDKIEDAYTKSDQTVHNTVDTFFTNPQTMSPKLNFTTTDSQLASYLENSRPSIEATLNTWHASLDAGTATSNDAKQNLDQLREFLSKAAAALSNAVAGGTTPQATLDGWKAGIAASRITLNATYAAITSGEDSLRNAESALKVAQDQLTVKQSGSAPEQITAQQSSVDAAQATVDGARAQLAKAFIRAPITGIVSRQDAHVGAIASPNTPVVSMISNSQFQIEASVSEAEVAKIHAGDDVAVTLDAYGDTVPFTATVASIDPGATVIQGVSGYRVVIQFKEKDERIKTGMTANARIITARKDSVLSIPWSSVIDRGGTTFVLVKNTNGQTAEREVHTGIRSGDVVEIVSGLKEGELVASYGTNK